MGIHVRDLDGLNIDDLVRPWPMKSNSIGAHRSAHFGSLTFSVQAIDEKKTVMQFKSVN